MRTIFVTAALVMAVATARADVSGVYNVKFEEVSTNCTSPLRYPHGKLTIIEKGKQLTVDIDRTPLMGGIPTTNGRISAKSKSGNTMVEGMTGVFSVAGKVTPEGQLQVVMIGEYSANGKPLCTQTWNVSGPRDKDAKPKKASAGPPVNNRKSHPVVRDLEYIASIGR